MIVECGCVSSVFVRPGELPIYLRDDLFDLAGDEPSSPPLSPGEPLSPPPTFKKRNLPTVST